MKDFREAFFLSFSNAGKAKTLLNGVKTEVTIVHDAPDYLHGEAGFIWATFSREQAEIVQAALQAQEIRCELRETQWNDSRLFVLQIEDSGRIDAAIDFVWRDSSGLRLQPDWHYPAGAPNESFLLWTGGR
jgi:hypothetical protein